MSFIFYFCFIFFNAHIFLTFVSTWQIDQVALVGPALWSGLMSNQLLRGEMKCSSPLLIYNVDSFTAVPIDIIARNPSASCPLTSWATISSSFFFFFLRCSQNRSLLPFGWIYLWLFGMTRFETGNCISWFLSEVLQILSQSYIHFYMSSLIFFPMHWQLSVGSYFSQPS